MVHQMGGVRMKEKVLNAQCSDVNTWISICATKPK